MRLATFNVRAETIATKPMFKDSFKRRRCLMPASGYYEWQHVTGCNRWADTVAKVRNYLALIFSSKN